MKLIRLILLAAIASALGLGVRVAWDTPPLKLRRIEIAGNERVSKEEIAAATGLETGTHLLSLSTAEVTGRLEEIPWIRRARVERIIPSKVRVTVVERKPVAEVVVGTSSFLASDDGVLLSEGRGPAVKILGLPINRPVPGYRIGLAQYSQALEIATSVDPQVRAGLILVRAESVDRITLELEDGVSIVFGAAEQIEAKNQAIRALLEDARSRGTRVASIDVRVPSRPALRPR